MDNFNDDVDLSEEDVRFWFGLLVEESELVVQFERITMLFPKNKRAQEQIKFHIVSLKLMNASLKLVAEKVKDIKRSTFYRNRGNELLSSNRGIIELAEMYTKSIAYALSGSVELAMAYANRAAISFKEGNYENCLLDIERSLENDYPDEMKAKLFSRRVRSLVALERPQEEIDQALKDTRAYLLKMAKNAKGRDLVEKTLSDKNHMAPAVSSSPPIPERVKVTIQDDSCELRGATGVAIQYSKKYGRHLIATKDFRPGDIIAITEPYVIAHSPEKCYRECALCTNGTTVGIPCNHCVNVTYCSTTCRDKAWMDYHQLECPILGLMIHLSCPTTQIMALRVTLKAVLKAGGVDQLKKMVKKIDSIQDPRLKGFTGNVFDCSEYAAFYTLATHTEDKQISIAFEHSLLTTLIMYFLATRTKIFGKKYEGGIEVLNEDPLMIFLGTLMMKNLDILLINGIGVHRPDENYDDMTIAPFTSLCNHSCTPNATALGAVKSIAFALAPIKAGDQIWDTYNGCHYTEKSKSERQRDLKNAYHFSCDCVACTNDWPLFEKLANFTEFPGLSSDIRNTLLNAISTAFEKCKETGLAGKVLDAKEDLVKLLDLLFEHANPCRQIINYQEHLRTIYGMGLDTC